MSQNMSMKPRIRVTGIKVDRFSPETLEVIIACCEADASTADKGAILLRLAAREAHRGLMRPTEHERMMDALCTVDLHSHECFRPKKGSCSSGNGLLASPAPGRRVS